MLLAKSALKGEFANYFFRLSDTPQYVIIWTENDNSIDRFP